MNSIYICFSLKAFPTCTDSSEFLEKDYQTVYKPLIKFLYTNQNFPFSFSFSGYQIKYFKKRKNELLAILKELSDRKQIEVLGGGYYNPILPLIYPADRNGQIDLLSAEIRQAIGKRPRGISLFADCWDPSLINNIHTCGIEYVQLNSDLVPDTNKTLLPIIISDLGKTVNVVPYYDEFIPNKDTTPKEFIDNITKRITKIDKKENNIQIEVDRIIQINFSHSQLIKLIEAKWFDKLNKYLSDNENPQIKISTIYQYLKDTNNKMTAYITPGMDNSITNLITENKSPLNKQKYTVYDYLDKFSSSKALYNKMIYLSIIINQYKNDKMRKKIAREKLWEAQNGAGFLYTNEKPYLNIFYRQQSFKLLNETEKILRDDGKFKESITCFDYDCDGLNEYVCRMDNYFSTLSLLSGAITELDLLKNCLNYANSLKRIQNFDNAEDIYNRGFFVDHFFTNEQFKRYINNEPAGNGVFSKIQYSQIKFVQTHHEIQLEATAIWKPTNQKIYLRKKYLFNSTGIYVQYIIKNESNKMLSAKLISESNISHSNYNPENTKYFDIDIVDNSKKSDIDSKISTKKLIEKNKLTNIQAVRFSDTENGMSFIFEPNEKCGFYYNPIIFKRPNNENLVLEPVSLTYVSSIFWDINLEPGKETEKSINLMFVPIKKIKEKK